MEIRYLDINDLADKLEEALLNQDTIVMTDEEASSIALSMADDLINQKDY